MTYVFARVHGFAARSLNKIQLLWYYWARNAIWESGWGKIYKILPSLPIRSCMVTRGVDLDFFDEACQIKNSQNPPQGWPWCFLYTQVVRLKIIAHSIISTFIAINEHSHFKAGIHFATSHKVKLLSTLVKLLYI